MKPIKKSALLLTSSASDIIRSGGVVNITGLDAIRHNEIRSVKEFKYKAEVVQVVTVGSTSYTPTANTRYAIKIMDLERRREGYKGVEKVIAYTTPAVLTTIGANAAAQREYIHGKLIDQINNATATIHCTAVTLAGGTGFTVTDEAGYYPANDNGSGGSRKGANQIIAQTNSDATGFTSADVSVTTDAVYSFGVGASLLANKPVISAYHQVLIAGELDAPVTTSGTYAVSGQKYDAFVISSLTTAAAHSVSGQLALVPQEFAIFVDNGTGTSTTNLTGYKAFRREMHRLIGSMYENDPSAIVEFFDSVVAVGGNTGTGLPTGGAQDTNVLVTDKTTLHYSPIATSTLLSMVHSADGLKLELDSTDNEGVELSAPVSTTSAKQFIVGKQEASIFVKLKISDVSGTDDMLVGFRKKEAYQAAVDDYDEMAALNVISGDIKIETILNAAATTTTDTTLNWADGEVHDLEVRILIDGTVKFYVDGVDVSDVQATAFEFDADEVVIPFVHSLQATDKSDNNIQELLVLPTAYWKI